MKLLLIRHEQTDWNAEGKLMGQHDAPLNDIGISQAEETSRLLQSVHIDLIVCSPLKRARQTADIINHNRNIPVLYDARVKNRNFGEFSGKTNKDFDIDGFWDYYRNEHYESAENVQDFFERIYSFLDDMIQ